MKNLIAETTSYVTEELIHAPGGKLIGMEHAKIALAAAVASGTNVVFYGPGGHAKSQLVQEAFNYWARQGAHTHIQTLSSQTNNIDLFGGLHPAHVKKYDFSRAYVERSWIALSDVACFEEIFDAPARVIASLKDLLVSRRYRYSGKSDFGRIRKLFTDRSQNGYYTVSIPLRTRSLIGLTNHDPADIAKIDPSVSALVERFPIQVEISWRTYGPKDFQVMFDTLTGELEDANEEEFQIPAWEDVSSGRVATMGPDATQMLSKFLGEATREGVIVSPRMGVYCHSLITSWAGLQNHEEVLEEDFEVLRFVAGFGEVYEKVWDKARYDKLVAEDKQIIEAAKQKAVSIMESVNGKSAEREVQKAVTGIGKVTIILQKRDWQDTTVDGYRVLAKQLGENITSLEGIMTGR